jgi:amidase
MPDDIAFSSATALAGMVRDRRIGCRELVDHVIARIERLDGALNAVVVRDFSRAREEAARLDALTAPVGPLHGVPVTVKESFDVAGLPTTWGHPEMRGNVAGRDALAVERLRAAGAIVLGKSNVPKSLADWQSYNAVYGATNNPWNRVHGPGGSSGGSAAAIAAGFSGLEMGSDIAGSIRQPAHSCGVFGHKPTWGLMPPRGHSLAGAAAMTDISCIGPLARSAEDLALALDLLGHPDPLDGTLGVSLAAGPGTLRGLRVALWRESAVCPTDPEIVAKLDALAVALEGEGAVVARDARPPFDEAEVFALFAQLLVAAMSGRASDAELAEARRRIAALDPADAGAFALMDRAAELGHRDWLALNERRHRLRLAVHAYLREWDVMICPAFGSPALAHQQEGDTRDRTLTVAGRRIPYNLQMFWPGVIGVFHLPATAVPLGLTRAGLPVGCQIVGPLHGDRITIGVARLLEQAGFAFAPPPDFA